MYSKGYCSSTVYLFYNNNGFSALQELFLSVLSGKRTGLVQPIGNEEKSALFPRLTHRMLSEKQDPMCCVMQ